MIPSIVAFVTAFFVGAIPTAYLFVKNIKGADIREHGSGNVGATNAARVLGRKMGLLIFLLDFFKGLLPALILSRAVTPVFGLSVPEMAEFIGFGAILGHIFTPFLGGRGGKGIATGAGVIGAGFPLILALMMLVWIGLFFATRRIVALCSLGAVASFPVFLYFFRHSPIAIAYGVLLLLVAVWTHRSNLSNLISK